MFLEYHLDRSYRSNEMPVILMRYFNFILVGLNFLGLIFVFVRIICKRTQLFFSTVFYQYV